MRDEHISMTRMHFQHAWRVPISQSSGSSTRPVLTEGDTTMITKSAIALAVLVSITSGALAATTHRHYSPAPASAAFAAAAQKQDNHGAKSFQDPMRPAESWDPYGLRWD